MINGEGQYSEAKSKNMSPELVRLASIILVCIIFLYAGKQYLAAMMNDIWFC